VPDRILTIMAVLVLTTALPARANPVVSDPGPWLDQEVRRVIDEQGLTDSQNLTQALSRMGLSPLPTETLALVRQNINFLEGTFLESQRLAERLDPLLHREFRAHASDAGISAMKAILYARLRYPTELYALRDSAASVCPRTREGAFVFTQRFIGAVETLADYREFSARSLLQSFLDTLEETPAESLAWEYSDPPSWFLRMASHRLDDPAFGAVFVQGDDQRWLCVREESDVACAETEVFPHEGKWQRIDLLPRDIMDLLEEYKASPAIRFAYIGIQASRRLRVRFKDGVTAILEGYEQGYVAYDDNTRASDGRRTVMNADLAQRICGLGAIGAPR